MKAAVCRAFGEPLSTEDINLAPPQADQIEVQIKACAVCHSDIFYADGAWGGGLPAVYGHEAAGIVKTVGANVTEFAVGDHVCVPSSALAACAQPVPAAHHRNATSPGTRVSARFRTRTAARSSRP